MKQQNLYISIGIILVAVVGFTAIVRRNVDRPASGQISQTSSQDLRVNFSCEENKGLSVVFHLPEDALLDLTTSDGRAITLKNTPAPDRTQYTSQDGSVIFWSKGKGAYLQEGTRTTFSNCQLAAGAMDTTTIISQ